MIDGYLERSCSCSSVVGMSSFARRRTCNANNSLTCLPYRSQISNVEHVSLSMNSFTLVSICALHGCDAGSFAEVDRAQFVNEKAESTVIAQKTSEGLRPTVSCRYTENELRNRSV